MSNMYSPWCTDCLVSLGYIPHVYLAHMEHQIHRTTPPHTLPVFYLWFFLHNRQCSPNLCVVFSTAASIYTNFVTPKQHPDRMPNHIYTSHIAKIRLTTHCIPRSQHALRVKIQPHMRSSSQHCHPNKTIHTNIVNQKKWASHKITNQNVGTHTGIHETILNSWPTS